MCYLSKWLSRLAFLSLRSLDPELVPSLRRYRAAILPRRSRFPATHPLPWRVTQDE